MWRIAMHTEMNTSFLQELLNGISMQLNLSDWEALKEILA